jgi:hypothetical protein
MFDFLVIKKDSSWKGMFDILMLFISCYNIFGNAYYSAFGAPDTITFMILDYVVEFLFSCDLIFCFCQEYLDEETYTIVSDIKKIAKHYAKKSFVFDLAACLPIENVIMTQGGDGFNEDRIRLFRLLKMFRLPRLAQLLDVEKFK